MEDQKHIANRNTLFSNVKIVIKITGHYSATIVNQQKVFLHTHDSSYDTVS